MGETKQLLIFNQQKSHYRKIASNCMTMILFVFGTGKRNWEATELEIGGRGLAKTITYI